MKKLVILLLGAIIGVSAFAKIPAAGLQSLLTNYIEIKNALIAGDAATASTKAAAFAKAVASEDSKTFPAGLQHKLSASATSIAESKDIAKQRTTFSGFSDDMIKLVKAAKPTGSAVYIDYCPMKKASWLSEEEEIKNPYYGDAMLSCGSVKETIKP